MEELDKARAKKEADSKKEAAAKILAEKTKQQSE